MTNNRVTVVEKIFSANDQVAELNRSRLDSSGVLAINVMASPGAGKTSFILQTIRALAPEYRIGVVEGDTAPVTPADILPYLKNSVVCPAGGKTFADSYSVSTVQAKPACLQKPATHKIEDTVQ